MVEFDSSIPGRTVKRCLLTARIIGWSIAVLGLCVLAGWLLDLDILKSGFPGAANMKPNTAIGLLLCSLAMVLGVADGPPTLATCSRLLASIAGAIGLLTLFQYLSGIDLGIDQLLLADRSSTVYPGRMAPATALALIGMAAAMVLRDHGDRRFLQFQVLLLVPFTLGALGLIGHALDFHFLYGWGTNLATMAAHTAAAFVALSFGAALTFPREGLAGMIASGRMGGVFARRALPVALLVPVVVAWARVKGEQLGWYDTEFGIMIMALSAIVVFSALILLGARRLNRHDEQLRASNALLETRIAERTAELEAAIGRLRAETTLREAAEAARQISEARFRNALEFAPIGMAIVGLDGRWIEVNRALCEIVGYDEQALLGLTFQDITHPEDLDSDMAELHRLLDGKISSYQMEKRYIRKNGSGVWAMLSVSLVRDGENKPLYFVSQIENISERRKVLQELADSRQFLSEVIDAIPIPLTVKDDQRRLIIVNDANDRFHGRASRDIVGKFDTDLYPPDLVQQFRAEDDAVLESGEPMIEEQAFTTMSGELRWVIKQKRRIALSDGRHWLIVTLLDITNRKQAEAALAEREAWLRLVTENSAACIGYIDTEQRFRFCNSTYQKWYGIPVDAIVGKTIKEVIGRDYSQVEPAYRQALLGSRSNYERTIAHNGTNRSIFVDLIPDIREGGTVAGAFIYSVDITSRVENEKALQESEQRFRSLTALSADWYWEQDENFRFTVQSGGALSAVNISTAAALGKTRWELPYQNMKESDWRSHREVLEAHQPFHDLELVRVLEDGSKRYITVSGEPMVDKDGCFAGYRGIGRDISARRLVEIELADSQRILNEIIDAIPIPLLVKDERRRLIIVNDAIGTFQGRSSAETLGKLDTELFSPDQASQNRAEDDAVLETGKPLIEEQRFETISGEVRWVFKQKRRIELSDGRRWLITTLLDISKRKEAELKVARSERFLEAVIEAIPQPVFLKDSQHRWVLFNSAFCELLGHDRAALLGRSDPDIYPDNWVKRVWAEDDKVLSGNGSLAVEEASEKRADGSMRWLLKSKKRVTLPDESTYIVGISTDITRLKQVEEALRKSDELHRLLAENSSDLISLLNPAGVIEYASPAARGLLDTEPEQLLGKLVTDLIHPDDMTRSLQIFTDVVKKQVPVVFTCRLMRSDQTWSWIETSFRAIRDADSGRTRQVIAVSRDINERVRVTNALNHFKYVLDNTQDMIFIYDVEKLRFSYVNEGAVRALGVAKEKLIGMAPWELRAGMSQAEFHKSIQPFLRGEIQSRQIEAMLHHADGSLLPVDVTMQLIHRPGEPGTFISVARDATERKKIERLKNEFVSTVSHELRTPLTSIRGSLGLLTGAMAGELPEQARQLLEIAHRNSERLIRLVNDILDIEKIESGKMRFTMNLTPLYGLLSTALADNHGYADQFGVHFVLRGEIPEVPIRVDADRIMQVMANLLSNAAKFSPRGADVEIAAEASGVHVRISVTDHGNGIPEDFRQSIFGKFSQADASDNRKLGGTGLGLSIAKAIVEKHGGTIGFITAPGQGTTFFFDLPLSFSGGQRVQGTLAEAQVPEQIGDRAEGRK